MGGPTREMCYICKVSYCLLHPRTHLLVVGSIIGGMKPTRNTASVATLRGWGVKGVSQDRSVTLIKRERPNRLLQLTRLSGLLGHNKTTLISHLI